MAKKNNDTAQALFMQRLKESLAPSISLVDSLADILEVSNDSAYRRLRGETALSIEEIAIICKHFKISFDAFINNAADGQVNFTYQPLIGNSDSFGNYLRSLKADLNNLTKYPDANIIYAAEDIPVFHHFEQPFLSAFKIFYWNKSFLNDKNLENQKFDASLIDPELIEIGKDIIKAYSKIPSVEIWSDDTVNSTFKQIEFYWESGIFKNKADALAICHELYNMLNRINRQAELNSKIAKSENSIESANNYTLYHSDVMIGNNCVMVNAGNMKSSYISCFSFNSMLTTNQRFCEETDFWLKNLIRKSNLISGVAEKLRYRYFKKIDVLTQQLIDKIEKD